MNVTKWQFENFRKDDQEDEDEGGVDSKEKEGQADSRPKKDDDNNYGPGAGGSSAGSGVASCGTSKKLLRFVKLSYFAKSFNKYDLFAKNSRLYLGGSGVAQ